MIHMVLNLYKPNLSNAEDNVDGAHSYLIDGYSFGVLVWMFLERLFNSQPEKIVSRTLYTCRIREAVHVIKVCKKRPWFGVLSTSFS